MRSTRVPVDFETELTVGNLCYAGVIKNLSENGVYVETSPAKTAADFTPETTLVLKFQFPSGEMQDLLCKVIWSSKTQPDGLTNGIGMEIIDPPQKYEEEFLYCYSSFIWNI